MNAGAYLRIASAPRSRARAARSQISNPAYHVSHSQAFSLKVLDPAGSVVILATLHISAREYYVPTREEIFLTPFWHCSYQEKISMEDHCHYF